MSENDKPDMTAEFDEIRLRAQVKSTQERIIIECEKRRRAESERDAADFRASDAEAEAFILRDRLEVTRVEILRLRGLLDTASKLVAEKQSFVSPEELKKAIAAERSACALACDRLANTGDMTPDDCAAAIRGRFAPLPNGLRELQRDKSAQVSTPKP